MDWRQRVLSVLQMGVPGLCPQSLGNWRWGTQRGSVDQHHDIIFRFHADMKSQCSRKHCDSVFKDTIHFVWHMTAAGAPVKGHATEPTKSQKALFAAIVAEPLSYIVVWCFLMVLLHPVSAGTHLTSKTGGGGERTVLLQVQLLFCAQDIKNNLQRA